MHVLSQGLECLEWSRNLKSHQNETMCSHLSNVVCWDLSKNHSHVIQINSFRRAILDTHFRFLTVLFRSGRTRRLIDTEFDVNGTTPIFFPYLHNFYEQDNWIFREYFSNTKFIQVYTSIYCFKFFITCNHCPAR